MGNHALLSASSSHRWLNCPPSARLGENYEDRGSDFAAEGTDAHSLCEHKLKTALGIPSEDPTENLSWYNEEMEECANSYAAYVLELLAEAKKVTTDPIVLIEQRLDYSKYVESGFGTGDCVLIADGTLNIVDYKHGKGVEVSAEHNPQMMLYGLYSAGSCGQKKSRQRIDRSSISSVFPGGLHIDIRSDAPVDLAVLLFKLFDVLANQHKDVAVHGTAFIIGNKAEFFKHFFLYAY